MGVKWKLSVLKGRMNRWLRGVQEHINTIRYAKDYRMKAELLGYYLEEMLSRFGIRVNGIEPENGMIIKLITRFESVDFYLVNDFTVILDFDKFLETTLSRKIFQSGAFFELVEELAEEMELELIDIDATWIKLSLDPVELATTGGRPWARTTRFANGVMSLIMDIMNEITRRELKELVDEVDILTIAEQLGGDEE